MNQKSLAYTEQYSRIYPTSLNMSKVESCDFRLVKLPDEKDSYAYIQVVGKSIVFKMLPEKIMRDDSLLRFSRADIAVISHLGTKNELKELNSSRGVKLFKILKQLFKKGKTSFVIEKEEGIVEEHAANDIYNNASITEKLSGTDGIKVGYSVAEEHYNKIIKLKEKISL